MARMKTLHLTIRLRDGRKVVAAASASAPGQEVDVAYSGEVSALVPICEKGSLEFVEWFLRARAGKLGASLVLEIQNDFYNDESNKACPDLIAGAHKSHENQY
jgi:hypothetical protein